MKKVNAKLTIPKLRTVCKYQQTATVKNSGETDTDPTTVTITSISHVLGGW